jgi:hypothetical protein
MKTPYLDRKINLLEIHERLQELTYEGKDTLIEYKAIKEQLILSSVVKQSEHLPDENLYQPCEGCTTSCKSWEVFFCKKLVG